MILGADRTLGMYDITIYLQFGNLKKNYYLSMIIWHVAFKLSLIQVIGRFPIAVNSLNHHLLLIRLNCYGIAPFVLNLVASFTS